MQHLFLAGPWLAGDDGRGWPSVWGESLIPERASDEREYRRHAHRVFISVALEIGFSAMDQIRATGFRSSANNSGPGGPADNRTAKKLADRQREQSECSRIRFACQYFRPRVCRDHAMPARGYPARIGRVWKNRAVRASRTRWRTAADI